MPGRSKGPSHRSIMGDIVRSQDPRGPGAEQHPGVLFKGRALQLRRGRISGPRRLSDLVVCRATAGRGAGRSIEPGAAPVPQPPSLVVRGGGAPPPFA